MGKVYLAKAGELYKIGSSENPEERIKKLQAGSPVRLELVYSFDTPHPRRDEATIQKAFADRREHGEWYRLTEGDILKIKQSTAPPPTSTPHASQQPSGARTGALAAINDIWAYRWYLVLFFIVAVPFFLWVEARNNLTSGYWENVGQARQTAFAPPPTAPAAEARPTPLPVGAPIAVQPPPLQGNAQPVSNQPASEQPAAELIPINDATAAALGSPPPPEPVAAPPAPTPQGFVVTWPQAPNQPEDIAEFAEVAQTAISEAGYTVSTKPTLEIPKNWVGQ